MTKPVYLALRDFSAGGLGEDGSKQFSSGSVMVMNRNGYRLVGEGDDGISASDWSAPISNCPVLLSIHTDCESCGYEFPVAELSEFLLGQHLLRQPLSHEVGSDLMPLLEEILGDGIDFYSERYDHNMPGASGVYYRAYLRVESIVAIESALKMVEDYLDEWRQSSGLASAVKAQENQKVTKRVKSR